MYNDESLLSAYKERNRYYDTITKYENNYPGSIGFVNQTTEIFVAKESIFCRLFCPHFHLYNHETHRVTSFLFSEIDNCEQQVLDFLNTVRIYSVENNKHSLIRTYYEALIAEWEIVNKCYFKRRFMRK